MAAKKILMLVGDYAEDYETMVPFQALLMVGHTVHAVCPDKRAGQSVRTAIHDFEGDQTTARAGPQLHAELRLRQGPCRGLRRPAGPRRPRPEYLRLNARVIELVKAFDAAGKPIAAVCHGAQLLAAAGVLRAAPAAPIQPAVRK